MNQVKLKDIAQVKMGQSPDSQYYNTEEQGTPFLQGCAQFGEIYPSTSVYCSLPSKIAPKGSILFSVRAPVGDINIADCDYCIGRGLAAITPKKINNEFLYYLLVFEKYQLTKIAQGSTFESINSTELENWLLPDLGSIPEQEQIAKILDTVDKAIAQTETLIAKYKRVKTGLMQDLLTRGIDEHGQLRDPRTHKFKRSPLGMIPDEWEVTTLDKVCINIVDCPHSTPHFIEEGVLIARTPQIKDGNFYINDASFVNEIEYKQRISRLEPKAGDIIFTREAPVGEAFIIPYNMRICLGQRTMLLRLNQKCIVAEYLLLQIYSNNIKSQIDQLVGGTTTPHLNVIDVGKFCFPLPKINEQQIMKSILDAQELTIKTKKAHLHKLQKIKTGLMQDLLTGKTSVKPLLTNQP